MPSSEMEPVPKRKRTPTKVVEAMDITNIRPFFTVPLSKAAVELGISENCLKKVCRRVGIARWPYREIADVQRTIQRIEQSPSTEGESDVRTSALLSGLRLQEQLLLTRGKSEQPAPSEPPSKMAKYDTARIKIDCTPSLDSKEHSLSSVYTQDDSTSKFVGMSGVYPLDTKYTDMSTTSSTPESSPHAQGYPFVWPPASVEWYHPHDPSRMQGSHFFPPPSASAATSLGAGTGAFVGHAPALHYQHQLWAAHAQAQWYADRAMPMPMPMFY